MSRSFITRRVIAFSAGLVAAAAFAGAVPAWGVNGATTTPIPTSVVTPSPEETTPPVGGFVAAPTPAEDAPDLDLGTDTVAAGDWIVASAEGYTPNENVELVLYRGILSIGTFAADSRGALVARVRIPTDTRPGEHVLEAAGWESGAVANSSVTVVSQAVQVPAWQEWWLFVVAGAVVVAALGLLVNFRGAIGASFRPSIDEDVKP